MKTVNNASKRLFLSYSNGKVPFDRSRSLSGQLETLLSHWEMNIAFINLIVRIFN